MNNSKNSVTKNVLIVSAPSGGGKSTIVGHLLKTFNCFDFSVSATSRAPRGAEVHGKEYFFLSEAEFKSRVSAGEFVEHEEVYPGLFYGTLKSEVERIWGNGKIILFDIDVMGGMNLKKLYGDKALSLFIAPPSLETLHERLVKRGTDTPEAIEKRVAKAEKEMLYSGNFDKILINDDLQTALNEVELIIRENF
ncbi:Guanylate kinase [bioreactor metagenome]|uniref:Guanylate kinase n=1 Tax=bioreactor metagenome TaxID=1076179 RepID=A0A644XEW2_9ZZZZ